MALMVMRGVIVAGAAVVSVLWFIYGCRSGKWLWPVVALCWLAPVMAFFIARFLFDIDVQVLNMISLGLYLMGISSLGGVALAKLKSQREGYE